MNYIGEFVDEVRSRRSHFQSILGLTKDRSRLEETLREGILEHWSNLPDRAFCFGREFAVDSSSAMRSLSNGIELFITRSMMIGNDESKMKGVKFEMIKAPPAAMISLNFERMLRDLIEVEAVLNNSDSLKEGDIVLVDGNLYGRLTHLVEELPLENWRHLPLLIFERLQNLFTKCREKKVMLVGVSKFSRTRVLCSALLNEKGINLTDPLFLDTEIINRFRQGVPGLSSPLLLGEYALERAEEMRIDPESYRKRFFRNIPESQVEWAVKTIRGVSEAPAIAMFHMTPAPGEQPLRVDIPASCLGIDAKIMDVRPYKFIDPSIVEPVVKQLLSGYGGREVYNALLWATDHEVRLGDQAVDTIYRQVIGDELGIQVEYDRSSRRFHG